MESLPWFFEGLGTALITFVLGLLLGGTAGYKIAIQKLSIKQSQKGGNNSTQTQTGIIKNGK